MKEEAKAGGLRTVKFCFPPMTATGNMHSKLQLLKFANYLRIVVPTGNLVPYDWGETGVMENVRPGRKKNPGSIPRHMIHSVLIGFADGLHYRPPASEGPRSWA